MDRPLAGVVELTVAAEPITVEAAFRRYARYVARVAWRLLGRDDELDDVVQEVFVAATRGLGRLRDADAVRGWLATVTVRIAHRRLRRRRLRAWLHLEPPRDQQELAAGGATPEERALLANVYAVLDAMPPAARVAWTLRHVEGERLEAVAALCGCSLATAKRRIAAAQAILDEAFADA